MLLAPIVWIFADNGEWWNPTGRPWWSAGHDQWAADYWNRHDVVPAKRPRRNR